MDLFNGLLFGEVNFILVRSSTNYAHLIYVDPQLKKMSRLRSQFLIIAIAKCEFNDNV